MPSEVFRRPAVRWGGGLALAAAAAALVWPHGSAQAVTPSTSVVTVEGVATETVAPGRAVIDLGVSASDASAAGALATVASRIASVVQRLSADGVVSASDIRTGQLNLFPQYGPGTPGTIRGYQASESLRVDVADPGRAGQLIDDAVAAGANQVGGITFLPAHPHQVAAAAYQQALAEAATQAQALAEDTHTHVLGIVSIDTTENGTPAPVAFRNAASAAVPVYPGTQQETVTVVVRYRLGP